MVLDLDPGIPSHVSGKQHGGLALLGSWYDHGFQLLGCAYFEKMICVIAFWDERVFNLMM